MPNEHAPVFIPAKSWYYGLAAVVALAVALSLVFEQALWLLVPAGALFTIWALYDTRAVFFLFFLILPFSVETHLPGGFGTDLPTEPIMIGLAALCLVFLVKNFHRVSGWLIVHPISLALMAHLAWIGFTTIFAANQFVALKYLLAKSWYVLALYVLAWLLIGNVCMLRRAMLLYFGGLMVVLLYTLVRHAAEGFTFVSSNFVMAPFYRNHVNYGAALTLAVPLAWAFYKTKGRGKAWMWGLSFVLLMIGVYFAYLRAAYVALVAIAGCYYMVRWRLTRPALWLTAAVAIFAVIQVTQDRKYLEYAPDFEKTISHTDFDDLLSATATGEDISTMERVYRWVAGYHMVRERSWLGFGPGNFYENYKPYAVRSFETYVSDNPEKSGVHSYYLMVLIEQGIPGLLLFLIVLATVLLYGEKLYHRTADPDRKTWIMSLMMIFVGIAVFQIINDLVETDKIGAFFFLSMAVLSRWDAEDKSSFHLPETE